jgi:hypothetical protein
VPPFISSSLFRFWSFISKDVGERFDVSEPPNSDLWTVVVVGRAESNGNKIEGTEPFPAGLCGKLIPIIITCVEKLPQHLETGELDRKRGRSLLYMW